MIKQFVADMTIEIDEHLTNVVIKMKSGFPVASLNQYLTNNWVMDFHTIGNTAMIQVSGTPSISQITADISEARFS